MPYLRLDAMSVTTDACSRAMVHSAWIVYWALPSDCRAITWRSGAAIAAPRAAESLADRSAGVGQCGVAGGLRRGGEEGVSAGAALDGDYRPLGQQGGDGPADRGRGQRAGREAGVIRGVRLPARRCGRNAEHVGQVLQRLLGVAARLGEYPHGSGLGQHTGLAHVPKSATGSRAPARTTVWASASALRAASGK